MARCGSTEQNRHLVTKQENTFEKKKKREREKLRGLKRIMKNSSHVD